MKGVVLSIERCSLNDGPGIRTTVFLKGCPLQCLWCHNPESISRRPELYFVADKCVQCGACVEACLNGCHHLSEGCHTIDRSACEACGRCVDACKTGALEMKGRLMSVEQVMEEVEKDRAYYESSGGGLTLSGGEPMAQFSFARELLRGGRGTGIGTCLETSGQASTGRYLEIAPLVDLFLFDWKESDPQLHLKFTGKDNSLIRKNLLALDQAGASVLLRCPIVPGLNDRPAHFLGIAKVASELRHLRGIEIMSYHPMGQAKSERIGKSYPLPEIGFVDPGTSESWRQTLRQMVAVEVL